jgi:hypothetical protein
MARINISQIRMKRGNTAASSNYVGPLGELLVDTGLQTIRIQDGVTPGGWLMSNTGGGGGGTNYSNSNVKSYLTSGVFDGNLIPSGNNIYSIGSLTNQWKSLYVSTGTIYINGIPLSLDANNSVTVDGNPISSTINYADIPGAVTDISQLTDENDLLIGTQGPQGPQGAQGIQGVQGIQGIQGNVGPRGEQGLQGVQGNVGPQGPQGIQGIQGNTGPQGERGIQGNVGPQGIQGNTGPTGAQGIQGNIGATGPQGIQGIKGDRGDQGISVTLVGNVALPENLNFSGNAGEAYIVTSSGNLFFWNTTVTNWVDIGPIVGPRGDRGDRGEQGIQGNVGLQGDTGPTGAQGEPGPQGIQGDTGPTGPQGDTGPEGPQGAQGIQGNVGPQGPQGIQGNIGPQGATGATGAQGVQGEAGIGVPAGGTAGQVLAKVDGDDYHTEWVDQTGGGGNVTVAPVTVGNTAEGTEGALWYNTEDGRTYVYALDTWIDANPPVVPGNMVGYGQDGNITLNEDARINYANGVSIMNSVYGDAEVAEFLSTYTGNIAKIGSAPLNITAASVQLTSDNETWAFAPDGVIALPNGMTIESYGTLGVNASIDIGGDDTRIRIDNNGAPPGFSITANATGGMASRTWLFGPDGNISFPDGTTQTTAYTGGGGGAGNALVNGGYTVALQANGVLTLGGTATISNASEEFRLWADNDITVYRNGQDGYGVKAGNIETFTDNALRTLTNSNGFEIKTGNIIIPNNKGVVFANGTNILSSIPSIGNITFSGSEIIGPSSDGNVTIRTTSGVPSGPVTKISDNQGWGDGSVGTNLPTTGGTGSGLTVDVVDSGSAYAGISINTPGTGYTNGDVLTVTNGGMSDTFSISVPVYDWQFGNTGNLTFPSNLTIGSNPLNPGTVISQANALISIATIGTAATYIGWSEFEYEPGNIALVAFNDTAGGAVAIQTGDNNDPGTVNAWIFDADGSTTFPDTTVQTTAWTGNINTASGYINFTSSPAIGTSGITFADASHQTTAFTGLASNLRIGRAAPTVSTGAAGDLLGAVAADENYLYYAVDTYGNSSYYTVTATGNNGAVYYHDLAKGDYPRPQTNWTLNIGGAILSPINSVTDGGTYWRITTNASTPYPSGQGATLTGNSGTVWKSVPLNTFQTNVVTKATGTWNVTTGTNTYSFTVPTSGTYQLWVDCNIPNGILVWNATATVTNTNVPVVGAQYAWVYNGGGSPIDFTSIPNQFIGTGNTIVRSSVAPSANTNRFDFGLNNTSGGNVTVRYGYVMIS